MQQPVIPRVRAPSDLTQTSMAIVIGNQVFGVPAIELSDAFGFQPLDGDLTSWAAITRAAGFDTFAATPSSANLAALLTDEAGSGAVAFLETGTFTPSLVASGATFSYGPRLGTYVKIGNIVIFHIGIGLATSGNTLTGNPLTITGMPFTSAATVGSTMILGWEQSTTALVAANARIGPSSTTLTLVGWTAASTSSVTALNANQLLHATNGTAVRVTGFYFV